jgi:hypothetical protein
MALRETPVDRVDVEEVDEVAAGHNVVVDELDATNDDTSGEER